MPGYYRNHETTAEAFTSDWWLKTGGLGRIKNRNAYLSGRLKNIIVTKSGKNIYPEEIKAEFASSETMAEIMVTGRQFSLSAGTDTLVMVCYPDYLPSLPFPPGRMCKKTPQPDFMHNIIIPYF